MKKILVLSIGVAMLAVSARANIVVSTGKDNIAAGTPGTRTMLAGKDSYYLIYSLTTANAAASISTGQWQLH